MTNYGDLDFAYNTNGELVSKTDAATDHMTSFTYDTLGNLTSAELGDGTDLQYVIDGEGRRVGKKVDGQLAEGFLYAPGAIEPIAELDGSGNLVESFVYGTRSNTPDYIKRAGARYAVITDHLGSPRRIVNSQTGDVVQEMDFDEFGRVTRDTNPGFQPFGFAGGLYDTQTKLTHFGAREYDAELGRWTSKDPIGFAGGDTNLYGYVVGDPVNFRDPTGLDEPCWI